MYPYPNLPKPLPAAEFYILLSLEQSDVHSYALIGRVFNNSLGSVVIPSSKIYNLIKKLEDQAFIEQVGPKPAGKSGKPRAHYQISPHGHIRLQEEMQRLNHAIQIGRATGLMDNPIPTDLQRLKLAISPPKC